MGRLVLVNSVLDSRLIHHMSALLLALGTLKAVDKRRRGFLWAGTDQAKGAQCLVAWEDVCVNKDEGGLGVKHLPTQNIYFLLKLLHRLHTTSSSSWATWVRDQSTNDESGGMGRPQHSGLMLGMMMTI
ncbi:hypothetical protein U9M48_030473 [Paspalum notatum var. saurae]|uniref:Uncharacterized protein n=1 Tax=Paspalum notatum var. saurae TaxID=547442 RepID=A0AAQ3U0S1_PASNO